MALDGAGLQTSLTKHTGRLGPAAGAYVVNLDTGDVLFRRRENLALAPASNEKLFVTAAALLRFGPDHTLATELHLPPGATIDAAGAVDGDVYLVGGGDPALDDLDLKVLAGALAAAGAKRITGGVRGDETRFDLMRGSYDSAFKPDFDLGGWLSALAWGHGRAGAKGPAVYSANRLQQLLKARGIAFGRKARAGTAPRPLAEPFATAPSPPMSSLAAVTNRASDNFFAEMLVKDLGASFGGAGTTKAGLKVVRSQLSAFGIHPRMVDGSGLSRANRATARQIVRLLERMRSQEIAPSWLESLAVAGRSGTLRKRMRRTAAAGVCQAKTGTLIGVSALSGYCTTRGGATLAFSFLENGISTVAAKRIEDKMVAAVAKYDG
jgi:D-alanyl-D-alanine carboxypeptidase/D-alanyl-D-alanine-endopeptidase (penicillin-binding protein 4)